MAKIGEGDQRWIVQERKDGKNVNNWHWTEKDISNFAKEVFTNTFRNLAVDTGDDNASITILKLEKLTGDVNICNRKGKTFFIHDFSLKLKWQGEYTKGDGEKVIAKGTLSILDIDVDHSYNYRVTLDSNGGEKELLKKILIEKAPKFFNTKIDETLENIKNEKMETIKEKVKIKEQHTPDVPVRANNFNHEVVTAKKNVKSMANLKQTITFFNVPPERLYQIFLDPQAVMAFTGAPCRIEPVVGADFSYLNGTITGKFLELDSNAKIVQSWRFKEWDENHYSKLVLKFEQCPDGTKVTLIQRKVPIDDERRTREGWESVFWNRIRGMFGWNYRLK